MITNNAYLETIGLSLVHSLWQGAILVFLVLLCLVSLRKRSARVRHHFVLAGLVLLPTILIANLVFFWPEQAVENPLTTSTLNSSINYTIPAEMESLNTPSSSQSALLWLEKNSSYVAIVWVAGMLLFLLKILGSFLWLKRLMMKSLPIKNAMAKSLLHEIKALLGIKRTVELKASSWIKSPVIVGIIRPTILLPIGLLEGLTSDEVEAILYHELSHLKRNDFVINIIINVLQIVFFYHPTYWWLKSQLDNEREFATDEMALQYSNKKLPMIKALAKVQAYSLNQPALGFAGNSKNQVFKRMNNMMNSKQQPNWLSALFTMALLLGAFALMSVQDEKSVDQESVKQDEIQIDLNAKIDSTKYLGMKIYSKSGMDSLKAKDDKYIAFSILPSNKDTVKVSEAIVDLVQNRASFDVEYDLKGQIKSISKNGKALENEKLAVYKAAWNQIEELNEQVKAKAEAEQLKLLRLREQELQDRLKSIDEQKKRMQEVDSALIEREHAIIEKYHLERLQQISRREWEYQKLKTRLENIAYPGNELDQAEANLIKELQARMKSLEDEMLEFSGMKMKSPFTEKEALERRLKDVERQLNQKHPNRVTLPGGEANEGILNVMLQPYLDKKASTVYILDGIVLTGSDQLEKNIERLRSIEIISGSSEGSKDFFGRDLEVESTIIRLSTTLDQQKAQYKESTSSEKRLEEIERLNSAQLQNLENQYQISLLQYVELIRSNEPLNSNSIQKLKEIEKTINVYKQQLIERHAELFSNSDTDTQLVLSELTKKYESQRIRTLLVSIMPGKSVLEINGSLDKSKKLEDLDMDEVMSLDVLRIEMVESEYPKRKLRGYDYLIRITTY